jgi:peptide/nickel transport system ATP-binding protein
MYAGRKIEEAATTELFDRPAHPYTRGLMASIPRLRGKTASAASPKSPASCPSAARADRGLRVRARAAPTRSRACRVETPALRLRSATAHVVACQEPERVLASSRSPA